MSTHNESIIRQPLVTGENITYAKVTDDILVSVENKPNKEWWIGFTVAALGALFWVFCVGYTFWTGIGTWGLNKTVGWAWDITNFVWWVGIGHAGTLDFCSSFIFPSKLENGD